MSRLVADVIVDVLRQAGVKRCYGIPGDTLNHICGSIQRSDMRSISFATRRLAALQPARTPS